MHAAIDIGTNTVLLLIARYNGSSLEVVREEQRAPRLGSGVDNNRKLDNAAVDRGVKVLKEYKRIIETDHPEVFSTVVTATSAVRDASNRNSFMERVKKETGFSVRLLSGPKEAEWTFEGALSVLETEPERQVAVLDIGGGSTEVALGTISGLVDSCSFDMGCVRFTERFLKSDPPDTGQVVKCRGQIMDQLEERRFSLSETPVLVGVAGTVTSLAYMDAGLELYRSGGLNGYTLSLESVEKWIRKVSLVPSHQLLNDYPEVMKGRADIFLAGLLILEGFMKTYSFNECIVSTGGIRHGAVIRLYNNSL